MTHPPQIVAFDLPKPIDPARAYMLGPDGREVPFQLLRDNKIAVEASLAANATAQWKLYTGRAPRPFAGAIQIHEAPTYYEIVNGLTGVRIARAAQPSLAPIQGILYPNGVWTATGPNPLQVSGTVTGMHLRFLERGPLKTIVEVTYSINRPDLTYGNKLLLPAGAGYYRSTVEIQAGQPSILIEDDTDCDLRYSLDIYSGLAPDQARYRGHHSTSVENGREPDGRQYRQSHQRPALDATVDLTYTQPFSRRLAVWDPWIFDSGWYWMLYNHAAPSDANLLGIFAGPASQAMGAAHNGAGISTAPGPHAAIVFETHRRSPDARVFPRVRIAWGIFTGTKGADLADPTQTQNIARQMNLHGGVNLDKIARIPTDFPDPPGGFQPLYMPRPAVDAVIARVRADPAEYHRLYDEEPTARPLLDMWRDPTGAKIHALAGDVSATAHELLDALVNGDGIYNFKFHYWMGGLEMTRAAVWIDAILTDPRATAADRARMKAAAALFSAVLWDPDFVPMFDGHGLNLGTANMPVQQNQYRDIYAILLPPSEPTFLNREPNRPAVFQNRERQRPAVSQRALANLTTTVNESGAPIGSTNYIGASMGPLLTTFQQLQTAGIADAFRDQPRLTAFAEFYLNLLTPPEPRFGGYRKIISIGDSSTESSELYGQLATGFAPSNPALSARLMAAWRQSGAEHSGFWGSTLLKIDESLPAANMQLGDANFPGWFTVLRNAWNTRDETAVWLVDGDFYRDHSHEDNGNIVIYALGAPLSLDWGSMYEPQSPSAFMHSLPVPESILPFAWNTPAPQLGLLNFRWQHATVQAYESFPSSAHVRASYESNGHTWTRSVWSIHPNPSNPVIAVRDTFDAPSVPHILTLNLTGDPAAAHTYTGQWLIDWDLYSLSAVPTETAATSWQHHWHPNREQNEFKKANGRPFEETQSILRIRTAGDLTTLILPRRKGSSAPTVDPGPTGATIHWPNATLTFDPACSSYTAPGQVIVTAFTAAPCRAAGLAISGGPTEVQIQNGRAQVTAHGPPGPRTIDLPGAGRHVTNYTGPAPGVEQVTVTHSPIY